MSSHMKGVQHLKVPLEDVKLATNNFHGKNLIAQGGFGTVYGGILTASGQEIIVAVKRLDPTKGQGNHEFLTEIQLLSRCVHENLVSLVGFCEENGEKILIYKHEKHGSLDRSLNNPDLSWTQRLKISIGAAHGFSYLHNDVGSQHRILHRDIKSSNILLNENWEAKICDFGLSKIGLSNVEFTYLVTNPCGTYGYVDPEYVNTGVLNKESDVYSFGVVLFEILSGRLAFINSLEADRRFLSSFAKRMCEQNRLYDIIFPSIKDEIKIDSLNMFSMVAYQCLEQRRSERPTMRWVVEKLEKALQLQISSKAAGLVRIGMWGKQSVDCGNNWSFELDQGQKLQKITINHGDMIHSLIFTTECRGVFHTSNKFGGLAGGETNSQVTFNFDEEIVRVNGTIGTQGGDTTISSLSFVTNKRTHGPFGGVTDSVFTIPFDKGSLAGFYGTAGDYINGIGIYVKPYEEITKVGTWGRTDPGIPRNIWDFPLERNHHLYKITVDHGDLIYSLIFTTIYKGETKTSEMCGGWDGGDIVSEVTFDLDEEIIAINGTIAESRSENAPGYTIISSISFVTNKRTCGPFGNIRGISFMLPWDNGSFAGFYGLCGFYLDSIGVYLKAKLSDI